MLEPMLPWAAWLAALWAGVGGAVLLIYRRPLGALWREPVFRCPILLLESDDWGAGPLAQAGALREIVGVLDRHRDGGGRPPVVSLALVLAVPDGDIIRATGRYARIGLDDARLRAVLDALRDGQARGVFALQLHGMEHYWPPTLTASADARVQSWLRQPPPAATESLPAHLQSRWVDARQLPSVSHPDEAIGVAVAEEIAAYTRMVGAAPDVVVPPTFVWTRAVERAWGRHGVRCVVTPGWRYTMRDAAGGASGDEGPIANGDRCDDLIYTVRNDYFEPLRGRDARHALRALDLAIAQGRPCVLENHRDNFIVDDPRVRARHLSELDALCRQALAAHPALRFLSTAELARVLRERDPAWLAQGWRERLPAAWARLRATGRLWKLARVSGAAVIGQALVGVLGRQPGADAGVAHG
jgi:hypothetical protein